MCQAVEWTFPHFAMKRSLFRASLPRCVPQLHSNQCERMTSNLWICLRQVAQRRIKWLWYVLMWRARAADVLAKHVELRPYPCGPLAPQQNTGSAPKLTQHPQQAVVPNRWWHTQKRKQMHQAPLHHMAATTPLTTQCTARINLSRSTAPILWCMLPTHVCTTFSAQSVSLHNSVRALTGIRCVNDVSGHLRFELLGPFDLFPLPLFNPCERQSEPTFRTPTRLGPFRSFGRS